MGADHAGGDIVTEFLDLFLYVLEEVVAIPPSYQHDSTEG